MISLDIFTNRQVLHSCKAVGLNEGNVPFPFVSFFILKSAVCVDIVVSHFYKLILERSQLHVICLKFALIKEPKQK